MARKCEFDWWCGRQMSDKRDEGDGSNNMMKLEAVTFSIDRWFQKNCNSDVTFVKSCVEMMRSSPVLPQEI